VTGDGVDRSDGRGARAGIARARDALARKGGQGLSGSGRVGGQWIRDAVTAAPAPSVPWAGPWKCTLAGILAHRPGSPLLTIRPLTLLDRFGALYLDTEQVGFDGELHDWPKVARIRLRNAFELLTTDALEQEVDRIRPLFPPIPGRKRALTFVAENMATVLLAAIDQGDDALGNAVVGELHYRGLLGVKHIARPGLFAAALLSLRPDIGTSLLEEAERHGVPVDRPETAALALPADLEQRVAVLRRRTDALVARLNAEQVEDDRPAEIP